MELSAKESRKYLWEVELVGLLPAEEPVDNKSCSSKDARFYKANLYTPESPTTSFSIYSQGPCDITYNLAVNLTITAGRKSY